VNKLKIYLDTNIISCLDAPETPERMIYTQRFWESVKNDRYDVVISRVTMDEIHDCPEPKHTFMLIVLAGIEYTLCETDDDKAAELAEAYIRAGGLPPRSKDDAMHIAYATLAECDAITSWNFKHVTNVRAMKAVERVNAERGYKRLDIYSPQSLIEFKEDGENE
jgi:predicted nucleic acid-binding protein